MNVSVCVSVCVCVCVCVVIMIFIACSVVRVFVFVYSIFDGKCDILIMSCQLRYRYTCVCIWKTSRKKREDEENKNFNVHLLLNITKIENKDILPNCSIFPTAHVSTCPPQHVSSDGWKHTIILTLSSFDYFLSEFVNDRIRTYNGCWVWIYFYAVYTMDKLYREFM